MNAFPKVSVIVPVYKVEKYIERCVRSLFGQTLDGLEFIFVNDCTPDKSMEVLNNVILDYFSFIPPNIKICSHSVNKGVASARNTGLDNATLANTLDGWIQMIG